MMGDCNIIHNNQHTIHNNRWIGRYERCGKDDNDAKGCERVCLTYTTINCQVLRTQHNKLKMYAIMKWDGE